jgi:hypothetical protein
MVVRVALLVWVISPYKVEMEVILEVQELFVTVGWVAVHLSVLVVHLPFVIPVQRQGILVLFLELVVVERQITEGVIKLVVMVLLA